MNTWIILSWVFVAVLTGINIFVFLKLKKAADQMLKMAFPGAKNMNEAMAGVQKMMQGAGGRGNPMAGMGGGDMQAQMKAAMQMMQQMQNKRK
jgi:hypothetical protein